MTRRRVRVGRPVGRGRGRGVVRGRGLRGARPQLARARRRARPRRARTRRTIAFCEVKTRRGDAFGSPAEAVTVRKQQRLRLLAGRWLGDHAAAGATLRFDVASVRPDGRGGWDVDVLEAFCECGYDSGSIQARLRGLRRAWPARRCSPVPAAGVPVPAILGRVERDHDLVALARADLVVAPGQRYVLSAWYGCTCRTSTPGRRRRRGRSSRARSLIGGTPPTARATRRRERDHDEHDVAAALHLLPERVESHTSYGRPAGVDCSLARRARRRCRDVHAQPAREEERDHRRDVARADRRSSTRSPTNPDDRVLVITGAGDGFCSGADLGDGGDRRSRRAAPAARWPGCASSAGPRSRLHELAKPTIAAVNGVAAGAGCNLALGCDLIVASDRARFSEIFSKRGLVVDFGGSWLLPRLVGMHRAKELVLLADIIDATEAERIGLVNRVVPHDQLLDEDAASSRSGSRTCRRWRSRCRSDCSTGAVGVDGGGDRVGERRAGADRRPRATPPKPMLAFLENREPQLHRAT